MFVIVGFGFKVSAVPFHTWAPDTYEGAPTPVTAFLSVASKAAGFVAIMTLMFVAFPGADDVYGPLLWVLAALTMTVGNVLALRQTNIVRMLAYSSVSQGGFILMPLAFAGNRRSTRRVGAEGGRRLPARVRGHEPRCVRGGHRRVAARRAAVRSPRSAGCSATRPGLAVLMTIFLASLAGIPPLGGWIAKFNVVQGSARRRHHVGLRRWR